jgi:hypothetical protein
MSYVRVSIMGTTPGNEVWSINPVFDPTGEFGSTVNQDFLDAAANAIAALTPGAGLVGLLGTSLTLSGCRVEVRDDSTDDLLAISVQQRAAPLAGSGTPSRGPNSALVISLRTNTPGGSGRGRLYWPCISGAVDTTLRMSSAAVNSAVTAMASYLHSMEDALATAFPTIGFDLAVRSRLTHTTPHVNKLMVGNVIDTQRRRRDKLIEDYTSVAF